MLYLELYIKPQNKNIDTNSQKLEIDDYNSLCRITESKVEQAFELNYFIKILIFNLTNFIFINIETRGFDVTTAIKVHH